MLYQLPSIIFTEQTPIKLKFLVAILLKSLRYTKNGGSWSVKCWKIPEGFIRFRSGVCFYHWNGNWLWNSCFTTSLIHGLRLASFSVHLKSNKSMSFTCCCIFEFKNSSNRSLYVLLCPLELAHSPMSISPRKDKSGAFFLITSSNKTTP